MGKDIIKTVQWVLILALVIYILFAKSCGSKPDVTKTVTRKDGKPELVKITETTTFDTTRWIATYKANTKPIIKWRKPKNDTVLVESKPLFSPCDSVFASLDSGTIEGVKYSIQDTTADNRVIGRSIRLEVPQTQITKQVFKTNDSLRVDTVYVETKESTASKIKWGLRICAACAVPAGIIGVFVPK